MAITKEDEIADWVLIAEAMRQEMARSPRPTFTEAVDTVIRNVDMSSPYRLVKGALLPRAARKRPDDNTVQRYLSALDFIEWFEQEAAEEYAASIRELKRRPVAGVGILGRWAAYDLPAALDATEQYASGRSTVEKLRRAEQDARQNRQSGGSNRSKAYTIRQRVLPWAAKVLGETYQQIVDPTKIDLPVDFLFCRKRNPDIRAAVICFGPFSNETAAAIKQQEFVFTAAGVSLAVERLIVVIVDRWAPFASYPLLLSKAGVVLPNLDFYSVDGPQQEIKLSKIPKISD